MNKQGLIEAVAKKTQLSKTDAEKAVKALLEAVTENLINGERVQLAGFGTFEVRTRKQSEMYIPSANQKQMIKASRYPAFSASAALKDAVK